jgi:hypothetical protein
VRALPLYFHTFRNPRFKKMGSATSWDNATRPTAQIRSDLPLRATPRLSAPRSSPYPPGPHRRPLGGNLNFRVFAFWRRRRIVVKKDAPLADPDVAVH